MNGTIHDMRQEYERQLTAQAERIAALEAALDDIIILAETTPCYELDSAIIERAGQALENTHTA